MLSTLKFQCLPIKGVQHISKLSVWFVTYKNNFVDNVVPLITSSIKTKQPSKAQFKRKTVCLACIKDQYTFLLVWRLMLDYSSSLCISACVCNVIYQSTGTILGWHKRKNKINFDHELLKKINLTETSFLQSC